MPTSAEMLTHCETNGLLSKEAAANVAAARERLIKTALAKEAAGLFARLRGGFGQAAPVAAAPKRLLDKLRTGGRTGLEAAQGAAAQPGWSDVGLNLAKMLALAGMTAGATAGIQGIMRHSRDKRVEGDIQSSYKAMFEVAPELKDIQEAHPGRVERHFGVLAKFAPSLAADPTVASAWIRSTGGTGYLGPAEVKGLAETQARIDEMNEQRYGVRGVSPIRAGEFATKAMGA